MARLRGGMALVDPGLPAPAMIEIATSLALLGGIVFVVVSAMRSAFHELGRDRLDPADVLRSAAIAIGLYLAMLAIAVGIVDLFQAIGGGDRIAGTNSDLARSLSLLIVGGPVFALLMRLVARHQRDQERIGLGWSIHLVASLITSLVAALVSAGQIIADIDGPGVESAEVAQMLGWLVVWTAYWFGLRPRFGVLGAIHLLAGTAAGLGWLAVGSTAVGTAVLREAYDSVFDDVLARSYSTTSWLLVAIVGLAVWTWHWSHLNSARGVEGETRRGRSWFVMVVALAIVPAVVAMLVVAYTSVAGILIWLFGTTDEPAAVYFDPAPGLVTAGLVAVAGWSYHRWLLARGGRPIRNESLRFHDYAVAAVGLVASITGVALVIALAFETFTARRAIAEAFDIDNRMIMATTALVLGAGLWWWMWEHIERNRNTEPVAECASVWRKLYLIVAAGLGGLLLAVSLVWVLFVTLRDLFDGVIGETTLTELADPIGWGIAVVGGAWFHYGVWRSDRAVLAAVQATDRVPSDRPPARPAPAEPPAISEPALAPPTESTPVGLLFRWATAADHGELFSLQRAAFVDEAVTYTTTNVPALLESFEAFVERTEGIETLVLVDGGRIIGAVGLRERDGALWLERLMTAPDHRRAGFGHRLVERIEDHADQLGHAAVRAVAGERDPALLTFFQTLGYETVGRTEATNGAPSMLVMEHRWGEPAVST